MWTKAILGVTTRSERDSQLRRSRFLAFGLFLMTAAALIAGGVWHHRMETKKVTNNGHVTLKAINDLKCAQIEHWRQERIHDLRWLAASKQQLATDKALDLRWGLPAGIRGRGADVF